MSGRYPKHREILFLCLTVLISISGTKNLEAQHVLGAREVSLGQASTALPDAQWALFSNPAMIPSDSRSISFFGIRYYGFSEITDMAASVHYPTNFGTIGIGAHRYGFDLFSENRVRVAYKNVFQNFHYGMVLNYNHITQGRGYGSAGALGIDLGIAATVTDALWLAARATNINQPEYGKSNEPLPRELVVGFSYAFSDLGLLTSEVVKDVRFPIAYRGGIEVIIMEGFLGRAGVTTGPTTFSGGFGFTADMWTINVVAQNHIDLGLSPGLDLSIQF